MANEPNRMDCLRSQTEPSKRYQHLDRYQDDVGRSNIDTVGIVQ